MSQDDVKNFGAGPAETALMVRAVAMAAERGKVLRAQRVQVLLGEAPSVPEIKASMRDS